MLVVMNDVVRQPCLILTLLITPFDVIRTLTSIHLPGTRNENDISSSTYNIINANPQTVHSNSSLSMSVARHRPKNNPVNVHSLAPFPDDKPGMQRMIACWHG